MIMKVKLNFEDVLNDESMMRVNLSTEKSPTANSVHSQLSGWPGLSETASSHLP